MSMQMMLLGAGAAAKKTYLDDVFEINSYIGNGWHPSQNTGGATSRNFVNGIDFTEGGLIIFRRRDEASWWQWVDSENGVEKALATNNADDLDTSRTNGLKSFNDDGFTVAYDGLYNSPSGDHHAFSFRKAKGFFDVVKWTGNATVRDISHNLGSVPGMIIIKNTSSNGMYWIVYHRAIGETRALYLNTTDGDVSGTDFFSGAPTDSVFKIGTNGQVNANGSSHVAYLFAGGESTAATARSVEFDGSNDRLDVAASTDFNLGTNDFTIEYWINTFETSDTGILSISNSSQNSNLGWMTYMTGGKMQFYWSTNGSSWAGVAQTTKTVNDDQWHHVAITRTGGNIRIYLDGVLDETESISSSSISSSTRDLGIGHIDQTAWFDGKLSNVRIINGTAVYTSSFKPPTEPLTNITNTKLLCCNDSSTTGKTVGPTITANGPTAKADSPFDDPAGFKFGESGNENVIKCGTYTGNGKNWDPEDSTPDYGLFVECGFEPQWVLIKRTAPTGGGWKMVNCHSGMIHNGTGEVLNPSGTADAEDEDRIRAEPTGFRITNSSSQWNYYGGWYAFVAIRRPDGYVGKPPSLGTDVFAMDTGAGSSTIPNFDSGFPVDFAFHRAIASPDDWITSARLIGKKKVYTNNSDAEATDNSNTYDSSVGWNKNSNAGSGSQSWMWKRHAGFDVVAYRGTEVAGQPIGHSLGRVPEMIWVKRRFNSGDGWAVYHKGLNEGSSPEDWNLKLDETAIKEDTESRWNDTAPTSTHFFLGTSGRVNTEDQNYIAMLFASVDKISKCGQYTGSTSAVTVDCGFVPRFVLIKKESPDTDGWLVFDTLRGIDSGDGACYLYLNSNTAQQCAYNVLDLVNSSTKGFSVPTLGSNNDNGDKYIYYAHA